MNNNDTPYHLRRIRDVLMPMFNKLRSDVYTVADQLASDLVQLEAQVVAIRDSITHANPSEIQRLELENENLRLRIQLHEQENVTCEDNKKHGDDPVPAGASDVVMGPSTYLRDWERMYEVHMNTMVQEATNWIRDNPPMKDEHMSTYYARYDSAVVDEEEDGVSIKVFAAVAKRILLSASKAQYYEYHANYHALTGKIEWGSVKDIYDTRGGIWSIK